MNRTTKKSLPFLHSLSVACIALVGLAAIIGSGGSSSNSPAIVELNIEPIISVLDMGSSELYEAFTIDADGNVTNVSDQVSWSLENQSGIVEFSENPDFPGFAYALAVMVGTDDVVATLGEFSAKAAVTVVAVQLVGLVVSPKDMDLSIGTEDVFIAEGTYDDGHKQDLTNESVWFSANPGIVSVSENGVATAESAGTTMVTASVDGLSDDASITVHELVEIESVEVSPQDVLMFLEGVQQFNAFANYTDGSVQNITSSALWISSDTNVIAQDIFRKGFFHAKSEGSAEIAAEFGIRNKGATNVTVEKVLVTHIIVTPRNFTLPVGETKRYFTEAATSDGKFFSVNQLPSQSYSISDPSIAYISNNPENKGILTALKDGTTDVFSTYEHEGVIYSAQATVTVSP